MNHQHLQPNTVGGIPRMSAQDFAQWGVRKVAYIKPLEVDGVAAFGIFAANGQPLGVMENLDIAQAAIVRNDLKPVSLH